MPFLDLKLGHEVTPAEAAAIAGELTGLSSRLLGKKPEVTAVAVDWLPAERWFVGGRSLVDAGLRSFFLKIEITTGTNTKDQKAAFVAAVFEALERRFASLAPASYVVVQEVAADAWGYAGRTQEQRYVEGKRL
jgi:4-oxalocrotonate tautomerase